MPFLSFAIIFAICLWMSVIWWLMTSGLWPLLVIGFFVYLILRLRWIYKESIRDRKMV